MAARKKVTVIGGGMTGGAIAQRLVEKGIADVVIQDDPQFAGTLHHGKALDMTQSASWLGFETKITATDGWDETAGSDVIVCTAGAPRKPGMSREDLLNGNADIVRAKVKDAAKASPNAVIIIFANPMDAMCHVALDASGFPRERIIGQGGALDTARFRAFLRWRPASPIRDVHAYVLGGHTDTTMVPDHVAGAHRRPAAHVAAVAGEDRCDRRAHHARRRRDRRADEGVERLLRAVGRDGRDGRGDPARPGPADPVARYYARASTASTDIVCGVMCQLGAGGIKRTFEMPVSDDEAAKIKTAADATKELIALLK